MYETVEKNHVVVNSQSCCPPLQVSSIRLAFLAQNVRMCGAEDHVRDIGMRPENGRHGVDRVFDALVAVQQTKRQKDTSSHAQHVPGRRGIGERHVVDTVSNVRDLGSRNAIEILQKPDGGLVHHHQFLRNCPDLAQNLPLCGLRRYRHGVAGDDDRAAKPA